MPDKLKVRWFRGIAHLSKDGRYTLCGERITRKFVTDQDATPAEFLDYVSRKCRACRMNASIAVLYDSFAEDSILEVPHA